MYSKILVCIDGSKNARRAAKAGAEIALKFDAELHMLTVVRPFKATPKLQQFLEVENLMGEPKYVLDEMVKDILAEARKHAEKSGVKKLVTHVKEGKPARSIVAFADDNDIDLIVIGSRGVGSDIENMLLGSVSHKVSAMAPCTVVIVR
ncbi:MAG: universal stress protein [Rhodospirillaceae bacterium]|nr:universal stress protein [Rhodospirillaceae bacterium]MBL6941822.1 universal stress protein [Rhodospirillales bacterium]